MNGYAHSIEISENDKYWWLIESVLEKFLWGINVFKKKFLQIALFELTKILIRYDFKIIDCKVSSNHLLSMGAENISRDLFLEIIKDNVNQLAKTTFE